MAQETNQDVRETKETPGGNSQAEAMVITESDIVVAAKSTRDGESTQKFPRSDTRMSIQNINHSGREVAKKKRTKTARSIPGKVWDLSRRVEKYELLNEIAQAPSGEAFGQLSRGDAEQAQKTLRRLFSSRSATK
jgi:hypothetical protein